MSVPEFVTSLPRTVRPFPDSVVSLPAQCVLSPRDEGRGLEWEMTSQIRRSERLFSRT